MGKKQTKKKMKIVGSKDYINADTGEIEKMQVISMEDRDFNFEKLWIAHIAEAIDKVGNQKMKVLFKLLELKNNQNLIHYTQQEIADESSVSRPVVSETLSLLEEANFLKKIRNGKYIINPDIAFSGGTKSRMNVLYQYTKPKDEKVSTIAVKPKQEVITLADGNNPENWINPEDL